MDVLARASQAFVAEMERFETTRDVNDNYRPGKIQLDLELLPEGRMLGLTDDEVGRQVRAAFFGQLALRQLRGTNEVEIRVELPEREREELRTLEELVIRAPNGTQVALLDIARVHQDTSFTSGKS